MDRPAEFGRYQDWTLELVPRCFYIGKGDQRRLRRKYRNKHHKHIAEKYGLDRRVLFGTRDEAFALEQEVKLIAKMHTFVHDPAHNGIGVNYTQGGDGVSGHICTAEQAEHMSAAQHRAWQDPKIRSARVAARNRPEVNEALREKAIITQKANWKNVSYRQAQVAAIKVAQNDPQTQAKRRKSNSIATKATTKWNVLARR